MTVRQEGTHVDLKQAFNPDEPGSVLELVKDLIAMANSGGGSLMIGYTETETPGIATHLLSHLDGARMSDQVNRYVRPAKVNVAHTVEKLGGDRIGVTLTIDSVKRYPLVVSRQGNHAGSKRPVFQEGDIWVRHGARTERATYEDIVEIINRSAETLRSEILQRLERVVNLPEGFDVAYVPPTGSVLVEPGALIDSVIQQRERYTGRLLDAQELVWCFVERHNFELTEARLALLVRSALRRSPTLFFWLHKMRDYAETVRRVVLETLEDNDRDKSDAANSILDVAAWLATDEELELIVEGLRSNRYRHFQKAAMAWVGREERQDAFRSRVYNAVWQGRRLIDFREGELIVLAHELAQQMLQQRVRNPALPRALGNIGRVIFLMGFRLL